MIPRRLVLVAAVLSTVSMVPVAGWAVRSLPERPVSSAAVPIATPGSVPAELEPVGGPGQPAAGATEVIHIEDHQGRLFAATGTWMSPTISGGTIVTRSGPEQPWKTVLTSKQRRITALESFPVPASLNGGTATDVLLTGIATDTSFQLRWLVGDTDAFTQSLNVGDAGVDIRSFGAHREGSQLAFYAGLRPTGIVRGVWDPDRKTIAWNTTSELVPREQDGGVARVAGMDECGGALYATASTRLYRRNDGTLPRAASRWELVYQSPPVGEANTGLRGLTCITHDGEDQLLLAREGTGLILRFGDLPAGIATSLLPPPVVDGDGRTIIGDALRSWGFAVPTTGAGSISYVIPAYNEVLHVDDAGRPAWLVGVEFTYQSGACPKGRRCVNAFEAGACTMIRHVDASKPTWEARCLGGDVTPTGRSSLRPVPRGSAFVATRTIRPSPWDDDVLFVGGYDSNSIPADGTGWLATVNRTALLASPAPQYRAFAQAAFTDFLGRAPTTTEQAQIVAGLSDGSRPRRQVIADLATSAEWLRSLVNGFYEDTLGRPGDAAGVAYWTGQLASGRRSVAQVAAAFYGSNEYYLKVGEGQISTWVADLYQKILGRSPDAGGLAYWSRQTAARGRTTVAFEMFQSPESARDRVTILYQRLLGRAPDPSGQDHWATQIIKRGDIALAVELGSGNEYYTRANMRFG